MRLYQSHNHLLIAVNQILQAGQEANYAVSGEKL